MKNILMIMTWIVMGLSTTIAARAQSPQDAAEQPQEGRLKIAGEHFKNDRGVALVMLYTVTSENAEKDAKKLLPFKTQRVKIGEGKAEATFEQLAFGNYAVVVLHDANMDGKPNHMGLEALGFSNNYKKKMFSSPKLQDLAVSFQADPTVLTIPMP